MMPALDSKESARVVFPWSTWAMTLMDRMLSLLSMMPRTCSTENCGIGQEPG